MNKKNIDNLIGNKNLFETLLNQSTKPLQLTEEKETDNHSGDCNDKKIHCKEKPKKEELTCSNPKM